MKIKMEDRKIKMKVFVSTDFELYLRSHLKDFFRRSRLKLLNIDLNMDVNGIVGEVMTAMSRYYLNKDKKEIRDAVDIEYKKNKRHLQALAESNHS